LTCGAEICAELPRRGIEGEQPRVDGRQKDPPVASIALGFCGIDPQGDAAVDETFGISRVQIDLRIKAPLLTPGLRVESDDAIERGGRIHRAADDDGGRLEFALAAIIAAVGNIAGVVFPGDLQVRNIVPVDLAQRRIAAAAGIAAVIGPLGDYAIGGGWLGGRADRNQEYREQRAPHSTADPRI
jgi:hypothetical protein